MRCKSLIAEGTMQNRLGYLIVALTLAGCGLEPQTNESAQAAIGPASITTDAPTYTFLTDVQVSWSGMPGAAGEWVALAPVGSPNTTVSRWAFTGGGASGTKTLEGPPAAGMYVARGFGADDSFQGESDPFVVQSAGTATVAPGQPIYQMADPIMINWSGLPGNTDDWISIAPVGSPDTTTADWLFTGGGTSGSTLFMDGLAPTGYPPGTYVARAFVNDSFVKTGESAAFTIGSGVTTNAASYAVSQPITVNWFGITSNTTDWIALAPQGSSVETVLVWVYTGGVSTGMTTFSNGLAAGTYVARAFENNGYTLLGESAAFTVAPIMGATISTNATMYTLGQSIVVTWAGGPGNALDWVAISPSGSPDTTVTRWVYAGGQANGSFAFEGPLTTGSYVARLYFNDQYTKIAESPPVTVQ